MIAMQMADEDMIDAMQVCLKFHQLHLGGFSAVNHEEPAFDFNELSGWVSAIGRQCSAGTENSYFKRQTT